MFTYSPERTLAFCHYPRMHLVAEEQWVEKAGVLSYFVVC